MDKQPHPEVDPVAVKKITGQYHQMHLTPNPEVDQGNKGLSGGPASRSAGAPSLASSPRKGLSTGRSAA